MTGKTTMAHHQKIYNKWNQHTYSTYISQKIYNNYIEIIIYKVYQGKHYNIV